MGFTRSSRAKSVDEHPLYRGTSFSSQRIMIPLMLFFIISSDGSILTYTAFRADWNGTDLLKSALLPFIATLLSIFQFVQRARRSLGCAQVVIFSTFCILLWLVFSATGVWTEGSDLINPWVYLAMPGVVLNIVYLCFGATALKIYRRRKAQERETQLAIEESEALDVVPDLPENQFRMPVRPPPRPYASTITSTASVPSTRPPSYCSTEALPLYEKAKTEK